MRKRFVTTLLACIVLAAYAFVFTACGSTVDVTGIKLNKTELALTVGSEENLTAEVLPENATDKTVEWTSSDEGVATVANGKVTAIKAGNAVITAKTGDKTATCTVTVKNDKLTEAEWIAAFEATMNARNFTAAAYYKDGYSAEMKFDIDNGLVFSGTYFESDNLDSQYYVFEDDVAYIYTKENGKWSKKVSDLDADKQEQRLFEIVGWADLANAKAAYSEATYNAEKDTYTVMINSFNHEIETIFSFADGKVSKMANDSVEITFGNYGTTSVILPEEIKNL